MLPIRSSNGKRLASLTFVAKPPLHRLHAYLVLLAMQWSNLKCSAAETCICCVASCTQRLKCLRSSSPAAEVGFVVQGYPGNLTAMVSYLLTEDNEVQIVMTATTDKATPVNLAQHCYFNLNGINSSSSTILNHEVTINA